MTTSTLNNFNRFNINPLPKVRMTQRGKWNPRARICLAYQQEIAWMYRSFVKTDWGKQDVTMRIAFFRSGRRCDTDNLEKAFLDGLQYGGAFHNDSQVRRVDKETFYIKRGNPFILFSIAPWIKDLERWGITPAKPCLPLQNL